MDKKKYSTQYQFIKVIKKTESTTTYLANKNYISFKNIIRQIDLSKITDKEKSELENEININSLFNSRFILKIEDSYCNSKQLNIISEYFEGKTLKEFLIHEHKKDRKFLKEEIIWKIFIQLCLAIYRIHSKNIIHRNIKTSTILLDTKYNLKLSFFKNAYILKSDNDICKEEIQLQNFMAPEIYKKEGYNTKSDIWSLGVVLYEMCTFNKPFEDENEENLYQKIINAKYASIGNKYSKELILLIDEMFKIKPEERISIKDIIHKYVFISRSKETNLFDYVDKIINPQKKRILSSKNNVRIKRPESGIIDKKIKKSANVNVNKKSFDKNKEENANKINKEDNKKNNDIEILTQQFFDVKNNVVDLIGKEKADNAFEELSNDNIHEIVIKYTTEDINSEKSQKLVKLLTEYAQIMTKVCLIKGKI